MKVLLFVASRSWGGLEKVFVELANHLAKECDLYVLLLKGTMFSDRFDKSVKVITTPISGSRRNPVLLFNLFKTIKKIRPDIVHTHAAKATEMVYFLNKLLKIEHVATKHNARKGKIFNKIKWVTTVSEQARGTIQHPGKVEVIYNGIIPQDVPVHEKKSPFSIVAVGRLDKYKGFDLLVKEVRKLSFDFILNIVGEGEERKNLKKLIKELKLEKKVFLLGHREDIPGLLAQAHMQVISSRTEGFSLVAVEGLFYSDVLISSTVGIAAEIMPDKLLYRDFNIAAKIEEIYLNYEDYREIFQKTTDMHRHRFFLPDVMKSYLTLYHNILHSQ